MTKVVQHSEVMNMIFNLHFEHWSHFTHVSYPFLPSVVVVVVGAVKKNIIKHKLIPKAKAYMFDYRNSVWTRENT